MIIESKFHDYYDSVMKEGVDKTIVYKRHTKEIEVPYHYNGKSGFDQFFDKNRPDHINRGAFEALPICIGFCGKIYFGYELTAKGHLWKKKAVAWSADGIIKFLQENKLYTSLESFTKETNREKRQRTRWDVLDRYRIDKFHEKSVKIGLQSNKFLERLFVEYHVPAFALDMQTRQDGKRFLTLNPQLKEYEFYKVVDSYAAFQEISMYLGGVLGAGGPDMVTISDKDKAHKHGMDKTSFRMPSPGKKFKRRSR